MIKINHQQTGMSLVELMVGFMVGLIVLLSIYGSFSYFQNSSQTGIAGNNALSNLILGLHAIENDVKTAALGFTTLNNGLACNTLNVYYNGKVVADNATFVPVLIQDPVGAPISLTVIYGNSILGGATAQLLQSMGSVTDPLIVNAINGFSVGDAVLISQGNTSPCTVIGISAIQNNGNNITMTHLPSSPYNPGNPNNPFTLPVNYSVGASVMDLGNLTWNTWQIDNKNNLQVVDQKSGTTLTIAENIVQMQAQYGITNGVTTTIQQWVPATGTWVTPTPAQAAQIHAIRIALVARSAKKEKPSVRGGSCDTTLNAPIPWPGANPVDLTANPEWRCYRYQTLYTVIPLKNLL